MEARPLPLMLLCSVVAAATGALVAVLLAPRAPVEVGAAAPVDPAPISAALARVEARQDELERALGEMRDAAPSATGTRSEVLDVDATFERWMQAHAPELAPHAESAATESSAARRE